LHWDFKIEKTCGGEGSNSPLQMLPWKPLAKEGKHEANTPRCEANDKRISARQDSNKAINQCSEEGDVSSALWRRSQR